MVKEFIQAPREVKTDEAQPIDKIRFENNGATVVCHPSREKYCRRQLFEALMELHRERYGVRR